MRTKSFAESGTFPSSKEGVVFVVVEALVVRVDFAGDEDREEDDDEDDDNEISTVNNDISFVVAAVI